MGRAEGCWSLAEGRLLRNTSSCNCGLKQPKQGCFSRPGSDAQCCCPARWRSSLGAAFLFPRESLGLASCPPTICMREVNAAALHGEHRWAGEHA